MEKERLNPEQCSASENLKNSSRKRRNDSLGSIGKDIAYIGERVWGLAKKGQHMKRGKETRQESA